MTEPAFFMFCLFADSSHRFSKSAQLNKSEMVSKRIDDKLLHYDY